MIIIYPIYKTKIVLVNYLNYRTRKQDMDHLYDPTLALFQVLHYRIDDDLVSSIQVWVTLPLQRPFKRVSDPFLISQDS